MNNPMKRKLYRRCAAGLAALMLTVSLDGCGKKAAVPAMELKAVQTDDDYRTCYEVFVYSFRDSDGDGIGDLKGLIRRLDYINDGDDETTEDLGCTELWTMPVFPSPTYHKYDATDYESIDPEYGTLDDLDELVLECHARGIRYIMDLALNHTSVEHPWFVQAADYLQSLPDGEDPDVRVCPYVDYYNFSREQQTGYEPLADSDWYYEARFWSGMPDLNLDSPAVRGEIQEIVRFWLSRGVDGFRLDAVTSYYTDDRSSNIRFLSWLNETVKSVNPDAYLVGEAWTSSAEYSRYYESGVDSFFDFDFAGQDGVIASVVKGGKNASYFAEAMAKEEQLYSSVSENYINAPFYTNHDMARSAGYYAYDDGSETKLAGAMNLLMQGNAFVYYGEELGMKGSGRDENKRAPMQWLDNAEGEGMCTGPEEMEMPDMKFGSLESQDPDPASIVNYYRAAIRLRNAYPVIARGKTTPVEGLQGKTICAFTRTAQDSKMETVMIVINTGEDPQTLDLAKAQAPVRHLSSYLVTGEDPAVQEGNTVTLPGRGIAVFTR